MEENKARSAELQAETEKLRAELKAKMEAQKAAEDARAKEAAKSKEAEKPREEVENDFEEIVIKDSAFEDEEKKKRKKRIFNIVYDALIVLGVALLIYGGYSMYQDYISSQESQQSYEELENNYVKIPNNDVAKPNDTESTEPARPKEWYEQIWVDLEGLQTQVNEDIVGWIYFENEDINYPILYSSDNNEYDRVRYDLVYAMCGSITLEAANSWDFSDIRNIIYGHNMRDLSMFGKLKYYKEDGYYQEHQYFQLMYDGMIYRYQIFSYFEVDETEVSFVNVNFNEHNTYEGLLEKLKERAIHETGVEVTAEDKTVTLLTCSDDKTKRLLVNAVLVDEHVMPNEDGTYPDPEPGTEPGTDEPDTEPDDPSTEPDSEEPGTEPDDRFEQQYTYTEVNKTMWATTGVKIRNQPSADAVRMGYLAKGQAVQVLAVCNENGWYRVQMRKGVGYVNGNYLTDVDPHVHTEIPGGTIDAHTKCEGCGMVLSAEHVYVDEVITPATDTTLGEMKHTCACGYSYTSEIPVGTVPDTGTETPDTEIPDTETPDTETPDTETPSTEEPGTEDTGTEDTGTDEPTTEDPDSGSESTEPTEPEVPTEEPTESEHNSESSSESETESDSTEPTEPEITE